MCNVRGQILETLYRLENKISAGWNLSYKIETFGPYTFTTAFACVFGTYLEEKLDFDSCGIYTPFFNPSLLKYQKSLPLSCILWHKGQDPKSKIHGSTIWVSNIRSSRSLKYIILTLFLISVASEGRGKSQNWKNNEKKYNASLRSLNSFSIKSGGHDRKCHPIQHTRYLM